jgi:hypothetical protein
MDHKELLKDLKKPELLVLFLFTIAFMHSGPGTFLEHKVNYDGPIKYSATDAFTYSGYSAYARESDQVKYMGEWMTYGHEEGILFQPPLRIIAEVQMSHFSGINIHNTIYIMLFMYTYFTILYMYFIIRKYKKEIAMLSLPLTLIIFKFPFNLGYNWGIWSFIPGAIMMAAVLFYFSTKDEKIPIYIILFSALFFSYMKVAHFTILFIGIMLIISLIKKEQTIQYIIKKWSIISIGSIIISGLIILILLSSWGVSSSASGQIFGSLSVSEYHGIRTPVLDSFNIITLILLGLGLLISFILKKKDYAIYLSWFLVFVSFSNTFLFGESVMKFRLYWPIWFMFFFGLTLYYILKHIKPLNKEIFFAILSIILMSYLGYANAFHVPSSLAEPLTQEGYKWIRENTPKDADILFFYGDLFTQSTFMSTERKSYLLKKNDKALIENATQANLQTSFQIEGTHDALAHYNVMEGLTFKKEIKHLKELTTKKFHICDFDYFVISGVNDETLMNINYQYIELIKENPERFRNNAMIIIQNTKGENCIG